MLREKFEKKKYIIIKIGKQNENENETKIIEQNEGNNLKIKDFLEKEKEFTEIKHAFQVIENKTMSEYLSSSEKLSALADDYEKIEIEI